MQRHNASSAVSAGKYCGNTGQSVQGGVSITLPFLPLPPTITGTFDEGVGGVINVSRCFTYSIKVIFASYSPHFTL